MALISVYKVVSSVPASLDSNALYLVRTGTGFDFYVSDSTGSVSYQINPSSAKLSNIVEDTTPQLGGDLDLNDNDITGTGNISITGEIEADIHIGSLRGEIQFKAKAGEALTKGDPVYISNYDTVGNTPIVAIADANDSAKMPCFGLANESVSLNASVNLVTFGTLSGLDTSGFSLGDTLYISNTGTLTNSKPTGESSLIQNIGKVQRVDNSAGSIKVGGAGRTNDVPNLNQGNVFIGNASNQAETRGLTLDDIAETTTKKHFTSSDDLKLTGIEAGAQVNVQPDWTSTGGDSLILNKPFQTLSSSGLIPTMTSNASGGYTASASSQFSTSYYAYKAFDNSTGTRWATLFLGTYDPFWVKIELPSAKRVWKASLVPYANYYPTSFRIEGSNDDSTWDVLGQGGFVSGALITFEMPLITHKSYLYYRLYGRHKYGSYGSVVSMQLYEAT